MSLIVLSATILLQAALVSTPPMAPWYASIKRANDGTDYSPIEITPEGALRFVGVVETPLFPYTREDTFRILLSTCEFTRAHGPYRVSSLQVELVNVLWHQPDRLQIFENLYERGNMPGKLHALVGLYVLDRSKYARRFAELPQQGSVVAQNGCAVFSVPVREIVGDIQNGILAAEYQKTGSYMTWLPKMSDSKTPAN